MLYVKLLPLLGLRAIATAVDYDTRSVSYNTQHADHSPVSFCEVRDALSEFGTVEKEKSLSARHVYHGRGRRGHRVTKNRIYVETFVTVVIDNNATEHGKANGYISADSITEQINALNRAYNPGNIFFTLVGHSYLMQPSWYTDSTKIEDERRRKLLHVLTRRGDYQTLNILFVMDIKREPGVAGLTYLPIPRAEDDLAFYLDGCILRSEYAPTMEDGKWTTSAAIIHEVGHWLGLHHIDEELCKVHLECCPEAKGLEPNNFMFPFTTGRTQKFSSLQFEKMKEVWKEVRLPPVAIKGQRFNILMDGLSGKWN